MKITAAHGSGGLDSALLVRDIFGKHFSDPVLARLEDAAVLDLPAALAGAGATAGLPVGSSAGPDLGSSAGLPAGLRPRASAGSAPERSSGPRPEASAGAGLGPAPGSPGAPPARLAFSTDGFVVTPLVFRGGDIGKLSVCGTVNDLLMMGAIPLYLSCGFILEEGLDIALLDAIAASMAEAARGAGVRIVAGDTKVAGVGGGLYINTAGVGVVPAGRAIAADACAPGDAILLSGGLGNHHACILSARMGIENGIESDCACLRDVAEALHASGARVKAMRDVTRGGLGAVLNEIADSSGCSVTLREEDIPVDAAVRAFCGLMGLDPLYMGNEGKMIAVVDGADAEKALSAARGTQNGKNAALIGGVAAGRGVFMRTRLGGTRRVDNLRGEGLPRIC
ncbi:MAG: hydrogenase expression/formation protein HypE [Clostridiales Family XIII bacterium]|jgi:hydrogenase expression/formation protein HypE|nr:hydrogenase expression/formation protein HypE [Clostridiales Family XIII bacterium]